MQELRARDVRRHLAHLEVERNELARVLDDLAAGDDYRRDVLEGRDSCNLEELEREALRRAAAARAASGAVPGAGDLPGLDWLRALVDGAFDLPVLREQDRLESRRTDVDSQI